MITKLIRGRYLICHMTQVSNFYVVNHVDHSVIMHQSIPAVPISPSPPTPGLTPGHYNVFKKIGQIPLAGMLNAPGWGRRKRCKCSGIVAFQHLFVLFLINQLVKRSTFQYFNATVRLHVQQHMLVD